MLNETAEGFGNSRASNAFSVHGPNESSGLGTNRLNLSHGPKL